MQQILDHIERRVRPSPRSYLEAERALTAALEAGNPDILDTSRQSVELAARQAVDMLHHLAEFVQHEWTPPFPDVGPVRIAIDAKCEFLRNGKHIADVYLLRDVSVAFKHHFPRTGRIDVSNAARHLYFEIRVPTKAGNLNVVPYRTLVEAHKASVTKTDTSPASNEPCG